MQYHEIEAATPCQVPHSSDISLILKCFLLTYSLLYTFRFHPQ